MIENFNNFRIRCGLSTELLDQNGQLKAGVKVDLGCWYLCIDTACVYICIADANNPGKAKLELLNAKNFAGKSELSKYAELAEVYTKGEIDALGFISEIPDEYLTLEQLNTELDGRGFITEHQSLANYATKAELLEAIKAIPQPDLTEYAKKSDIPDTSKFITEIPDNYVTEETLANKGYLTSDSISGLASTDYVDEKFAAIEHPLTGLATEEFVTEKIAEIEIPDVSNFATKDELPSVAGLATETFVHEMIAKAELDDKDVDLDAYYTKEQINTQVAGLATKDALAAVQQQSAANDVKLLAMGEELVRIDAALETIPSIEGLASEQFVTDKINDLEIPSIAGFASETYVDSKIAEVKVPTKVTELDNDAGYITAHQDISHLATKDALETVESKIPTLDGYAKIDDMPSIDGLASEQFVTEKIAAIDIPEVRDFITMPDVEAKGYATETFVTNKIAEAVFAGGDKDVDLTGLVTKDEIKDLASISYVNEKIAEIEIPEVPAKVSELENDAGYITTADIPETDLSNYYNKTEAEKLVTDAISDIEFPTTDLTGYAKEEWVKAQGYITDVSDKADSDHNHDDVYAGINHAHDEYASVTHDHDDVYAAKEHSHADKADTTHTHTLADITDYEAPSFVGYATETYVGEKIAEIPLGDYALKSELPSVEGLASETWVEAQGYLKEHQSLNDYYNKSEVDALIPSTEGFIKMADVEAKGYVTDVSDKASIDHKHDDLYEAKGAVQQLKNELLNGADEAYDTLKELGDLIAAEETAIKALETIATGKADKEHTHSDKADAEHSHTLADITDYVAPSFEGYATNESVDEKIATIPLADYALKSDIPSIEGLATEEFVTTEIAKAQVADKDVDLTGYAKESFVTTEIQKAVDNIVIPEVPTNIGAFTNDAGYITLEDIPPVDLSGKADVGHTHEEYAAKEHEHTQYLTKHQSLAEYAKKSELPDISTKADKEHTHEQYLTQQDISDKADVNHKHDDLYEVKGAAEAVKNDLLNGAGDAYDTLKELGDLIANNKSTIEVLETVATGKADKEHSHDEYALKESLSGLASKSELPTLTSQLTNDSGYITASALPTDYLVESDLTEYVKSGAISDMATKTWVGEQGFITNVEDKADKEHTHEEYLTADALTGYSKFSGSYKDLTDIPEIPSIEGLASTTYVDEVVSTAVDAKADKEHKHDELYDTKGAAEAVKNELLNGAGAAYDTLKELGDLITNNKDALDALSEIATGKADKEHSHEEYAEKEHTHEQYITDISGKADVVHTHEEYALKSELPSLAGFASEEFVTTEIAKIPVDDFATKAALNDYALKSELPSTEGLATETFVTEAIAAIPPVSFDGIATEQFVTDTVAAIDLSDYAKKTDVPSIEGLASESFVTAAISEIIIPEIPEDISAFNNDAGYLTSDALTGYAKADHAHEELATKEELAEAISNIEHPTVDLTGYATEGWVESKNYLTADDITGKVNTTDYQADKATFAVKSEVEASLAGKLDNVIFTENYLVKNPIGNFAMNAPVMGMSLKDILINMLGLELYVAPSLPENVPEETPPVVSDIIANSVPVHTLDGSGNLVVTEQTNSYVQLTPAAAKEESDDACFYQIVDPETNELVESGYQVPTVEDSEDWMTVAIPETVTAFHVEQFNPLSGTWERVSYELVPTDAYTADGYIVYTADGTDGGPTIRIVID